MAKFVDLVFIIFLSLGVFYTFIAPNTNFKDFEHIDLPLEYNLLVGVIFLLLAYYTYINFLNIN